MKKYFLLLIVYIIALNTFAQKMDSLRIKTPKFYHAYCDLNFDKVIGFYHPNYTLIYDRKQIKEILNDYFTNKFFDIRYVPETPYFAYSKIVTINKRDYCIIKFKYKYREMSKRQLTEQQVQLDIASHKNFPDINYMKFEKKTNSYLYERYDKWIAVLSKETNYEWRFIEINPKFTFPNELISPEILKELGL